MTPALYTSPAGLWHAGRYRTAQGEIEVPALWGRPTDAVAHLMDWVHQHVRKALPDERWMRTRFLKRSVPDILAEGTTYCLRPCAERTLVAATVLSLHGFRHRIVTHERRLAGLGPPSGHLAIEFDTEHGPYWFDFGTWESKFFAGTYTFRQEIGRTTAVKRVRSPFGQDTLHTAFCDLMPLLPSRVTAADLEQGKEWFIRKELPHARPRHLSDRIVFSKEASRYTPRWQRLGLPEPDGPASDGTGWTS
ncbi:hypothetical protein ACH4GK_30795 [Streptomyces rimosus]|uniref:hypothetical protein n=1 Tax=Streptomyces rimosus TaxID=1927 RepID=UPI0004CA2E97|nr:hypothetical protein [Streptomyces rimosus]